MKIYILPAAIALSAALWSCTEQAVELEPKDSITYDVAFATPERCDLAILGCYDAAQSGYYPGNDQRRGYPFGAASIEQGDMKGEDMVNTQSFFAVTYDGAYNASSPNGQAHWECTYQMINKINVVIEGLRTAAEENTLTAAQAADGEAEIRFLRALGLHELLVFFSMPYGATPDASHYGVPVSLEPINTVEKVAAAKEAGRLSVKQTYDQILEDLEYAEANLVDTRSGNDKIVRATKGAAIAAKARIYQHMGDWNKVISESAKIVSAAAPFTSPIGGYQLTARPDGVFANNSSNTESLFSIENSDTDNPTTNGCLYQMYYGRSLVCVSPIIINASFWLESDIRREQLIELGNRYGSKDAYWSTKYRSSLFADYAPVIRYAEALLNYAEAEARVNGVTQKAVDLLNAVRNRAVTDASKQFTITSFANADALVTAILQERRIEFLAEGRRWPDIHRLTYDQKFAVKAADGQPGIPDKAAFGNIKSESYQPASGNVPSGVVTTAGFNYQDRRYIFPIPESETSSNEKLAAQQNTGW
ncbi:MAG: RagB/SusD family nutrient uptake outer membrane protein [Tannerellaceae bacterium]|nr:RagB/SusD family nutrient uptake outer membrane protein [Tannerellaceae bacterium]